MPRYYVTYTDPDSDERRVAVVESTLALAVYRAEVFVYGLVTEGRAVAPGLVRGVSTEAPPPKGDGFKVTLAPGADVEAVADQVITQLSSRTKGRR